MPDLLLFPAIRCLIILRIKLEEALRMVAHRALLRSSLTNVNVSTVAALPNAIAVTREHNTFLDVLQQFAITLLVVLLYLTHSTELRSNLGETFSQSYLAISAYMSVHS